MVGILNSKIELSEVWKAEKHLKYSHAERWQALCELFLAKIKAIKRRLLRKKVRRKSNWRVMISSGFCRWPNQNTRALQVHVNLYCFFPIESLKCVTWLVEKLIILNVFSGWILRIAFNKSELNGSHLEWSFGWRQSWFKEKLNYKLTFTQVAKTSSTKINLL